MLFDYLESKRIPFKYQGLEPNMLNVDPYLLAPNRAGAKEFNYIYKLCKESNLTKLQRTKSGGIVRNKTNTYAYDIRHSNSGGLITIYAYGRLYSIKIGYWAIKNRKEIHPFVAFGLFKAKCEEFGIDLDKYSIKNGKLIKRQIPKPYIWFDVDLMNKTLYHVHHIDFHNSYPAGLVNTHPEFRPVVEYFYYNRDKHPEYKAVLNYTIGMMQSLNVKAVNARWAHLSRDAIKDNNDRIDKLSEAIVLAGGRVIGNNTDGIWYIGDVYHGKGEGPKLGQWENDHVNCMLRAKSHGAYEFVENGKYSAVVRGLTSYDNEVPREQWKWGDIYKSGVIVLDWDENTGFNVEEEN